MLAALLKIALFVVAAMLLSSSAQAREFNVRSFGAMGDGHADDGPALQHAIDAAIKFGNSAKVIIPDGTYRLGSSPPASNALLRISGANSLTISGQGKVLLVSAEPQKHIVAVERSSDIHIEHLALDRTPLLFSQAVVTSIDPGRKTAMVAVEAGYDPLDAPFVAGAKLFIVFSEPASGTWGDHSAACAFYKPHDPSVCWPPTIVGRRHIQGSLWEVSLNVPPQANYVGKRVLVWSGIYKGHAFLLRDSRDISVEGVHYYGGGGDGFVVTRCQGQIVLRDFSIGVPPGSSRLFAGTGGGMVFNNHAHVVLSHVRIANVWDDDLNIGANYARIFKQSGPASITVDDTRGDFAKGDHLGIVDWITKAKKITARVSSLDCNALSTPVCDVGLDHVVVVGHTGYAEVRSKGNDQDGIDRVIDLESAGSLTVENSSFQSLHARCLLIRSSNSIVKNSECVNTVMAGFMIGPQFFWDEGPQVENINITNNKFIDVSGPNVFVVDGGGPEPQAARGIFITSNSFVNFSHYAHGVEVNSPSPIVLQKTEGTVISGNTETSKYVSNPSSLVADLAPDIIIR